MTTTRTSAPFGLSNNHADYQAAFLQRIHRLLQLAYESLKPANYQKSEEDDITGDLCKHMKHLTEVAPTERWMSRFSVHDQDPSNEVVSAKTGLLRKGKRRPKIDIRIVCKHQIPNRGYCIEAKRFYRSDSVSEYVNDEGIGAFLSGNYGRGDSLGGMMGYIQSDEISDWTRKIESKLSQLSSVNCRTSGRPWEETTFDSGPTHCFLSSHERDCGNDIMLVHVMFIFVGLKSSV